MKKYMTVAAVGIVLMILAISFISHHSMVKEIKAHGVNAIATPYGVSSHYDSGSKNRTSSTDYAADFTYTASGKTYHIESKTFINRLDAENYLHRKVHVKYLPKSPEKAILVDGSANL